MQALVARPIVMNVCSCILRRLVGVRISGHHDHGPPPREGCSSHRDVLPQRHMVRRLSDILMAVMRNEQYGPACEALLI